MPMVSSDAVSTVTLMWRPLNSSGFSSQAMTQGSCSGPPSVPYFSSSKRSKNSSISAVGDADLRAERAEGRRALRRGQRLVGDVERHHDDRHAGLQHDVGGVRVDIDVELGRRRDIAALEEAAAHQHDLA